MLTAITGIIIIYNIMYYYNVTGSAKKALVDNYLRLCIVQKHDKTF